MANSASYKDYFITQDTAQKRKFFIKNFFSKCDQIRSFFADLVTRAEEIFNGKLHFSSLHQLQLQLLCSGDLTGVAFVAVFMKLNPIDFQNFHPLE